MAYGEKGFVHIATGNKQLLRNAPSSATVITAEEIAAMGATDLDEVMETIPGVHVGRSTNTYPPVYIFRGIFSTYNPQVLMLVNGKPVTDMFTGSRGNLWGGLPLENISRIEVIRGPGSALYGADSYAGTINLVTKTAAELDGTQFGVRAGSFDTWTTWAQSGGNVGPIDVAAYVQIGATNGQNRIISQDYQSSVLDPAFGTNASLAPGSVNLGRESFDAGLDVGYEKWQMRLGVKNRFNMETGAGVSNALDPNGSNDSHRFNADLSWHDPQFTKDWSLSFDARFLDLSEEASLTIYPPGARLPTGTFTAGMIGNPSRWQRQYGLSTTAQYTGFNNHRLRIGAGHDALDLYKIRETKNFTFVGLLPTPLPSVVDVSDTSPYVLPYKRYLNYTYLQDEWTFAQDLALTAGIRYDHYSDFGATTNPRLALVWNVRHDLTAKVMYGTAFRAPSINESASVNNPVAVGNPSLQAETIETLEAGISWQPRQDTQVNLSLFTHRLTDIIRLTTNPVAATGKTYQNTGEQTGNGGELEVTWDATKTLRVSGNYAYQKNIDQATNHDAGYAPHHMLYTRADWRFTPGWQLNGQVNYVADRSRAWGDNRQQTPDYTTVDLTLRTTQAIQGWGFAASARNLFDADVREPSQNGSGITYDLPMPGRTFWLQARYSL
ncbi:MAG: TonB-dependent receptor [Gammaproteobacteria bacterium]|nr:TonB-dependent receptor [Gammaproteobacteria bacterium]MBU1601768.1 TonB-dependent receptor [Gammaproteobacteria bacterium]MBU2432140.1 TonB-dependent receptor [Gammaproteobacteria bacterium]MBU2450467.1 TonB-dependent receptor [Gammaproteobacteria bacterium]